jgi:saccharopine dehydrogenase (NAD+, L-lysine-forming)
MSYLIYGAYGYTGELIARHAVAQGHEPVLAGRNQDKLDPLAAELGCPAHALSLTDGFRLRSVLEEVEAVVHCAGPFAHTALPMVEACLDAGTHYLDITGEIDVFEGLMARDPDARAADVMLLPGIGFDVVPTDCLANGLAETVTAATDLEIAFMGRGGVSHGAPARSTLATTRAPSSRSRGATWPRRATARASPTSPFTPTCRSWAADCCA